MVKLIKESIVKITIENANLQLAVQLSVNDYTLKCIPTTNNSVISFLVFSKSKKDNHQFYLHVTYGKSELISLLKQHQSDRNTEHTADLVLPISTYPLKTLREICNSTKQSFLQTEKGIDILTNNLTPITV